MGEQIVFGLKVAVLGLGTTFVALFGLILVIGLVNRVLHPQKKEEKEPNTADMGTEIDNPIPIEENSIDDKELVAVITAAVAASLERTVDEIVVRKVKRVPFHTPGWNITSRSQQIMTRL
ncbi:MAG: OadG family protein [Clostridiales bacterium]|nr:OadG family protein [Clostridiales bacterium]